MTLEKYNRLQTIAETINTSSNIKAIISYQTIEDYWKRAIRLNANQNSYLKSGDNYEVIKTFSVLDEDTRQIIEVNVKAEKNYSRLQWFKLLLACDYYFYTSQMIKNKILAQPTF